MADQASQQMMIKASPERCYEIASDFENYPNWAADIKKVEVLERDEAGRPSKVAYRAAAMGRSTRYVLAYDYSQAPRQLSWVLVEGDMEKTLDGTFVFEPADDQTEVTYYLSVELVVPVPGFLKRRAESRILDTLNELKVKSEA